MVQRKYTKLAACSAVIRRVAQKPKWRPYCFWQKLNLCALHQFYKTGRVPYFLKTISKEAISI